MLVLPGCRGSHDVVFYEKMSHDFPDNPTETDLKFCYRMCALETGSEGK